jgi:hypothetical protein
MEVLVTLPEEVSSTMEVLGIFHDGGTWHIATTPVMGSSLLSFEWRS